ncbi:NAD kinase [Tetragenococcus koreensis]|uniref:NAD kinase n=1 Tax=Tetragenococcus koreensis TaxID=290335 RepID=A0AAN4RL04_9ENTE|nr:NAD kinase [Tetragenococcus koreensis]AYW45616.1 NAD kinase [Tetragenococcus koreensis]MCF1617927.1 NAD kinase [Tetragenococcus koreensis]MCF1622748.1 NAD kinase [Tetragenococcus koreensis]MCF1626009.1 NAD kinase [Tetragenococcus koreensis]MCF1631296.1 NAD kinase [Tetragenococcus koreensis]
MTEGKVAIIQNKQEASSAANNKLTALLKEANYTIDQNDPDIVISIGGDGTFLSAFHEFDHKLDRIRFLGVHTGHLGFYTDWRDFELEELVSNLSNDENPPISYPLLDVQVKYYDQKKPQRFLALNEATIKRATRTMVADVYIKDEIFERFRGDGLSVSTPTGSTAYNKSVGGAVLHPRINAFQLAEIASLNNRVFRTLGSPIIISDSEWLEISLEESSDYMVTIDRFTVEHDEIESISFKIADERVHFASYRHMHFWRRVKDSFIGEV